MDKDEIKRYLKSYRGALECAETVERDIRHFELLKEQEQAKLGGNCDGMPRAPGVSDTTYNRCQRAMQLYDKSIASLQRTKEEALERLDKINELLNACGGFKKRLILAQHYCRGEGWSDLAERLHYSSRQIRRYADEGLASIEKKMSTFVRF